MISIKRFQNNRISNFFYGRCQIFFVNGFGLPLFAQRLAEHGGIRLTGMPGYSKSLTDSEMWQVSLLLLHADKVSASVQQALRK